jgi:preprotein translocase subunit SecB
MSTNGAPGQDASPQAASPPTLNVLAQYVKELSFENPRAPRSLVQPQGQPQAPNIQIQVNVNAKPMSDSDIEVELKIEGHAGEGDSLLFSFDLLYAGVFRIQNVSEEDRGPVVLIECPRLLFPFARQIIADAVRNGGFPPLMIDPIDFVALYRQQLMQRQQAPGVQSPQVS